MQIDTGTPFGRRVNTPKLRHIQRNANVSLNLDGDGQGGNIVVLNGTARISDSEPKVHELPLTRKSTRR